MQACEQMQDMSVLAHGESVHHYYCDLRDHILHNAPLSRQWRLPEWCHDVDLWQQRASEKTIERYQVFHDCGKPYCQTEDKQGRKQFPDHANISADIWKALGQPLDEVALMRNDMIIHTLRGTGIDDFCQLTNAATLLITGLCELHSNAAMFGGIESTSFKIKWKNINKFGKRITNNLTKQLEKNT
jgi:hypothetical protein